jgi:hypothetical protein
MDQKECDETKLGMQKLWETLLEFSYNEELPPPRVHMPGQREG